MALVIQYSYHSLEMGILGVQLCVCVGLASEHWNSFMMFMLCMMMNYINERSIEIAI